MAKDPVCGMEIEESEAAATSEFNGTTYYFCAPGCKRTFDKDPMQFLAPEGDHDHHHGGGHCC